MYPKIPGVLTKILIKWLCLLHGSKRFFFQYFLTVDRGKHLNVGKMKQKNFENSICLLNKNYVYLASESPRGVNFHFHDSNLSGLQTPRNRN